MALSHLDIAVIIGYLAFITLVGLWVSKKAAGSAEAYFLGGRSLPWFLLGVSGMATFIDIGGTSYQSAWFFLMGTKGFWFAIEGAVAILLAFQMVCVGKWLNRSGVMTNAQWMVFRFGAGKQGETARVFSAVSALALCAASMAFFFVGSGKGLVEFLPIFDNLDQHLPALQGVSSENIAGLLFFIAFGISAATTLLGTFLFPPTDMDALVAFYKRTRPFGFWGPVRARCDTQTARGIQEEARRDMTLLVPAIAWQLSLFLFMSSVVFRDWTVAAICTAVFIGTSMVLYHHWYKNLGGVEGSRENCDGPLPVERSISVD